MENSKPAIVVVAYRRLHTLKRLLHSIKNGIYTVDDITLIISIDYHKDNNDVVECAREFQWTQGNKIIKTHEENLGLRRHIIECGDYSTEYGAAIILEDDVMVAPAFYEYSRLAHDYYDSDSRIAGISLYAHEWNGYAGKKFQPIYSDGDVYFGQFSCSRGQTWSAKQWGEFKKWYEKNDEVLMDELLPAQMQNWKYSWGKFFVRYIIENDKYYVMPYKPISTIFGETGTNTKIPEFDVQVALYWGKENYNFIPFESGIHYDIFFENIDIKTKLAEKFNLSEADICIDIYALKKRKYGSKRYILTTRKLNKVVLDSYDLNMRPQDMNVVLMLPGEGIYFYDITKDARGKKRNFRKRLEYDFAGVHGPEAILYGMSHCMKIIAGCFYRGR